jgi:hypothetical protein
MNRYSQYFTQAFLTAAMSAAGISLAYSYTPGYISLPQPQQEGAITYVTGGIGDEERDALKAQKKDYNLSIVSADKSGAYVGDTRVVISNRQGEKLLDTQAGPLFYANLPPGNYVVEGDSEGQIRKQNITVAEGKPASVHFTWK